MVFRGASADTIHVIERSTYYFELSGGTFDIAILPILDTWKEKVTMELVEIPGFSYNKRRDAAFFNPAAGFISNNEKKERCGSAYVGSRYASIALFTRAFVIWTL